MYRLAVLVLAVAVVGLWLRSDGSPSPPPVTVVIPPPATAVVVVQAPTPAPPPAPPPPPAAPPVDADGIGPCPAPYTRATDVPVADPPSKDLEGLAVGSHDVRLLAVWSLEHAWLSTDEGRSWQPVLDHDGAIEDVAFDCHGRLHMVRADGELGTFDDGTTPRETWTRAATFHDGSDDATLIPDGNGVALLGNDPASPATLVLARRDGRGRWRTAPLLSNSDSWDGASVNEIELRRDGRFRMIVSPWQGGECGYNQYQEVTFALDGRRPRVIDHGEDLPDDLLVRPDLPELDHLRYPVRDRAGRWAGLPYFPDAEHPVERLSTR